MDEHCRTLVQATALLHDIGKYISMRSHSLYTYKLIMSTDILGFSDNDKKNRGAGKLLPCQSAL